MANRTVRIVPATIERNTQLPIGSHERRKVAAYARVSTDTDEQLTSYEAQVDYYARYEPIITGKCNNLSYNCNN